MTERCPTSGYTCVDHMVACIQACADQIAGFVVFAEMQSVAISPTFLLKHYRRVGEAIQETLDGYVEGHGPPSQQDGLEAMLWVLNRLNG